MSSPERKIAFKLELSRMLELLADQIYQSPLALLRENTQNAFDAIRMREALEHSFEPVIRVTADEGNIVVKDNGIGMTASEIETNFWYAGRSGKNTDAARAAGVVGTFGIGAMANFGVADELSVESESAVDGRRTRSSVRKSELSTETESISITSKEPTGEPGTIVHARLAPSTGISLQEARNYLHEFVEFVDVTVLFNDEKLSGARHRDALPSERHAWRDGRQGISLAGTVTGNLELLGMASGELRVILEDLQSQSGLGQPGVAVLLQGRNAIRTLRTGFGLAAVAMQSVYQWGGVVDLPFLMPTAGREALDSSSNQQLQQVITQLDHIVSPMAAEHVESFANDSFLRWLVGTGRFDICGPMEVTPRPGNQPEQLVSVVNRGGVRYYSGRDDSVIRTHASEDEPLVVLSRRSPRRDCELGYLVAHGVEQIDTTPRVTRKFDTKELSFPQSALATRICRVLEEDYFIEAEIHFGTITGGLSLLVTDTNVPIKIFLNPESTSVAPLLALYDDDFNAFGPFVKDFIRSTVFPRISQLVPSSTREGAEAFLRHLRSNRDWFEYELGDKADLEEILEELHAGTLTVVEAKKRLADTDRSFVDVSRSGTAPLSTVVQGLESEDANKTSSDPFVAMPGIDRRDEETNALILTSEKPVNGYNCFLAISDRVQRDKGHFFLQPHSTEVVWGGRKVIFIFQHHSRRFGLYYDILCPGLVGQGSGGGPRNTSTILTKNRTFIPIPSEISETFLPRENERKRLEIRCDILYLVDHPLLAKPA